MRDKELRPHVYAAAQDMYDAVDDYTKEDLFLAVEWAKKTLTDFEGSGHYINVYADKDKMMVCCFAKPQWNADHCSQPMESAACAIIMAVCEYLSGV